MLDAQFYDLIQSLWGTFAGAMAAVRLADPTPPRRNRATRLGRAVADGPGRGALAPGGG